MSIDLVAVLTAVTDGEPQVSGGSALPSGPFELDDRSLQSGLRAWVERQTGRPLGYLEQLYTFADRDRVGEGSSRRVISISYLGLTREERADGNTGAGWHSWHDYFPWEDRRLRTPAFVDRTMIPRLRAWVKAAEDPAKRLERAERLNVSYGLDGSAWNEELILQRYELAFEAGIIEEATRAGTAQKVALLPGRAMIADHRRILATGIARLRAKIKYRPVVFELMPPSSTLLQLQRAVEALAGQLVHKPNFRRLIEQQELVEETGATAADARLAGRVRADAAFFHAIAVAARGRSDRRNKVAADASLTPILKLSIYNILYWSIIIC